MSTSICLPARGRRTREPIAAAVALALLLAAGADAASAQQAPADGGKDQTDSGQLEPVTVTAQFRKQNLQETPLAVTAITGDMLDARSQTSLADVMYQAPNVKLQQNPAGGGNSMLAEIRGVGQSDFDPALDPGVGIYVDDVYFATLTGSDFQLLDLDRVEILRGPQGTLSGMNSLGGSVKMYSQKANGSNDGYIEATYGSLNRIGLRASGDFTLVPDTLFLRLSAISNRQSGYVNLIDYACSHPADPDVVSGAIPRGNFTADCKTGTEGGVDDKALRASLRWLASDNVEVNWISDVSNDNDGSTASSLLGVVGGFNTVPWAGYQYNNRFVPTNPYNNYANFLDPGVTYKPVNTAAAPGTPNGAFYANPNNTMNEWGTSLTVDWKISDTMSLKSISAYRQYDSTFGDDNSDSPVPLVLEEARFRNNQVSQELRLNGSLFGPLLDYTLGGIYFHQHTEYASREDDPAIPFGTPSQPTFDFLGDVTARVETEAVFANTAWHLLPGLTFNGGLRYTKENKQFQFGDYNIDGITPFLPLSNPADPLNGKVGVYDGSHVDYRLDLDYQWTKQVMSYVSWSTGFKGGGITPRPYYPEQVVGFGPETLKSWEAGLKSQWFDNRLRANLAAFYEDYYGYQASANLPQLCVDTSGNPLPAPYNNPCGEYVNAADAIGKGVEAEINAEPIDRLLIDATYSYIDIHFTHSLTPAIAPGSPVPGVGKNQASFGTQYEVPMATYGSLTPRIDLSYTPSSCGDLLCDSFVENQSYTLVNGRLTYWSPKRDWSLALEVTNLTNKLYYYSKVYTGLGYINGQIAQPREWAVSLRKQF